MLTKAELEVGGEVLDVVHERFIAPIELANTPAGWEVVCAARGATESIPQPEGVSIPASVQELARHLSQRLQEEAVQFEEGFNSAKSIDHLLPLVDRDVEQLRARWIEYGKNPDGTVNEQKAQAVMIAAYVSLYKFALVAQRFARPAFDRNGWRAMEKSIEEAVEDWFKRQADGSPGLRRVK